MYINEVSGVNMALSAGLGLIANGEIETSRNGAVRRMVSPVCTLTVKPMQRVLFSPMRNANPFFHFMEALWMLAGRNDLPWLAQFNKRMAEYSDDGGQTQPAAYGHRWRAYFGRDQLNQVAEELTLRPDSRRAVLTMWDSSDMQKALEGSKDVPCNTHAYFRINNGALDMTVCCRSNDLWWGAHGANAVHFSILQEYVAAKINVGVGVMHQISNDYHLYTDVVRGDLTELSQDASRHNYYGSGKATTTPLFCKDEVALFNASLPLFMAYADPALNPVRPPSQGRGVSRMTPRFMETGCVVLDKIAIPMLRAWDAQKHGHFSLAFKYCSAIGTEETCDWRIACAEWVERKYQRNYNV